MDKGRLVYIKEPFEVTNEATIGSNDVLVGKCNDGLVWIDKRKTTGLDYRTMLCNLITVMMEESLSARGSDMVAGYRELVTNDR